jgi:Fur family ferric uptake transcriptional regulator
MPDKKFQRHSQQRDVILEELRKVKTHPTATILYNAVRKRIPNISLGTVYRNLDLLSQKGIIQKLEVNSGEAHFDGDVDKHYHIICTDCGRIDDVHGIPYENKEVEISRIINGYQVSGYHMSFFGICPGCSRKNKNNLNN